MASEPPDSSEAGFKDRFFEYFKLEVVALQDQIERLVELPASGNERTDGVNHCLAGITSLQRAVSDASSQLPAQNQKSYSETIKILNEKLQKARDSFAPRQKFSFKNARKHVPAVSLSDTAESPSPQHLHSSPLSSVVPSTDVSTPISPPEEAIQDDEGNYNATLRDETTRSIRAPSFSRAQKINLYEHENKHIILPISAARAITTGSIRDVKHCVIDMSLLSTRSSNPPPDSLKDVHFATLSMKNISHSLIITGSVVGATQVTNLTDSVIATSCGQLRMHDCRNVDVYVKCASGPIIEHCTGMRFAPLPPSLQYRIEEEGKTQNQWDKVQDFQWIKAEHSPNWSIFPEEERVKEETWRDIVKEAPGYSLDEILGIFGKG